MAHRRGRLRSSAVEGALGAVPTPVLIVEAGTIGYLRDHSHTYIALGFEDAEKKRAHNLNKWTRLTSLEDNIAIIHGIDGSLRVFDHCTGDLREITDASERDQVLHVKQQ